MPWKETSPMDQRVQMVAAHLSGMFTVAEICEAAGVSRKTVHKWIARYREEGAAGLEERSRAPHSSPQRIEKRHRDLLLAEKRAHKDWGARKLIEVLRARLPELAEELPSPASAHRILEEAGLTAKRTRRPQTPRLHSTAAPPPCVEEPNALWCADFKGDIRLGNGAICHPLTVTDAHCRRILLCTGLASVGNPEALAEFTALFREIGLPETIRTDNGTPFSSAGIGGLSKLSIQWAKLGIAHQLCRPAKPQDNGRHERMHKTLKAETAFPAAFDMASQQARFDAWRKEFNEIRPHEGLGMKTPNSIWRPPSREMPAVVPEPEYPGHFAVRRVHSGGDIEFRNRRLFVSEVLLGERVGLEEVADGVWSLMFCGRLLARMDERTYKMVRI